jgi:hypothetical protein
MIKIGHFIQALKTSWVKRYINGINDHWSDLVDTVLNLEPTNRIKLAHLGADNPKVTMFFQAFNNINHAFHRHKERNDNRWKHRPLFYNPSLTREEWKGKVSKKPTNTQMKKVQKQKLLELKNINNAILKKSRNLNLTPKEH